MCLDNIGAYGTGRGDLFVSTSGWHPYGAAPYKDDSALTGGERWEYAVDLASGSNASLYATNQGLTGMSTAPHGYIDRAGQETTFTPFAGQAAVGSGNWSIQLDPTGQDHVLHIAVGVPVDFSNDALGFHCAMTCGNDVIECGMPPVPEPATLSLMSLGLGGIAALRKRKKAAMAA